MKCSDVRTDVAVTSLAVPEDLSYDGSEIYTLRWYWRPSYIVGVARCVPVVLACFSTPCELVVGRQTTLDSQRGPTKNPDLPEESFKKPDSRVSVEGKYLQLICNLRLEQKFVNNILF